MKKLLKIEMSGENGARAYLSYINRLPPKTPDSKEFCFVLDIFRRSRDVAIEKNAVVDVIIQSLDHWISDKSYRLLTWLDIEILEWHNLSKNTVFLRGNVTEMDFCVSYQQETFGVLNMWQNGQELDWLSLDYRSPWKRGYLSACLRFSSVHGHIVKKEAYLIDVSLLWEEDDMYYLGAEAFFGKRGYMGYDFHTFKDCASIIAEENMSSEGITVRFLQVSRLKNYLADFYRQVKEVFARYKFTIEEQP
jgi:hypothetical protein